MEKFMLALQIMFTPLSLSYVLIGVCVGIIGGALPGISTVMTLALMLPMTYTMDPAMAVMTLGAITVGSTYGGSISAALLNVPGTPASAATALEGYPMTANGQAKTAVGLGAVASFFGSIIGIILLVTVTPLMVKLAMLFSPWEYFWFAMFGLIICANLSRGNFLKGIIAAVVGILLSQVGMDTICADRRFTFGQTWLLDGFPLIPVMIGLYGMAEVMTNMINVNATAAKIQGGTLFPFKMVLENFPLVLRVSLLGFVIGVIPGVGANIASWVGYDHAKSTGKFPELFGHGSIEGMIGSEAANNACVPGAYAPLLALGIPGDNGTAMILGALIIYGVTPGPTFLMNQGHWLYMIAISMLIATIVFVLVGAGIGRIFIHALVLPQPIIMTVVSTLCVIGAYSVSKNPVHVYMMFAFGIIGVFMRRQGFPIAPFILGMVLGRDIIDTNFRRAMLAGDLSLVPFFTRPVSAVLLIIILFMIGSELLKKIKNRSAKNNEEPKEEQPV